MSNKSKNFLSTILIIIAGLLIGLGINKFIISPVHVDGPSMDPNLHNNELVFANHLDKIKRGSVVIFNANGVDPSVNEKMIYVKRVIGLPGDTVESKNGQLYVNGKQVNQSYINASQRSTGTGSWNLASISLTQNWIKNSGATKVPKGCYFVLGDNRKVSNDSRYWGFVPKDKIEGVVKVPFWNNQQPAKNNINDQSKHYFNKQ